MNEVQKVIFDIYKEIAKVCKRHGIQHFAIGGTAIGAVRHGGFIPWDDDIDMAVPIEDWDRLIAALRAELPEHLYLYTPDEHKSFRYLFIKVCDRRTTFIEECEVKNHIPDEDLRKGIFVDIMPAAGFSADPKEQRKAVKIVDRLMRINDRMRFTAPGTTLKSKITSVIAKVVNCFVPVTVWSNAYYRYLRKHIVAGSETIGNLWNSPEWRRLFFPTSAIMSPKEVPYEDGTMCIARDYDKYLTMQFGNYMKVPDVQDRETHHGYVSTTIPFDKYQLS